MKHISVALLLVAYAARMSASSVDCITTSLRDNAIVPITSERVTLSGKARSSFPLQIVLQGSSGPRPCSAITGSIPDVNSNCQLIVDANSTWSTSLQLEPLIASKVQLDQPGCNSVEILVTPANPNDIKKRPRSAFQIDWTPEGERKILAIAADTLPSLSNTAEFMARVKREFMAVATSELAEFDIAIGTASASNTVHILEDVVAGTFAWTKKPETPDCGDLFQNDVTEVYVGTIADDIHSRPIWAILKRTDGEATRADDIGHMLGIIVAHEILHASGLLQCVWMQGDVTGHNDPRFERGRGHRYQSGQVLLDTFAMVPPEVLIGRSSPTTVTRSQLANDTFASNYLRLIHPRP